MLGDWLNFTYNVWSRDHNDINKSMSEAVGIPTDGPPEFTGSSESSKNIVIIQKANSLLTILNQYILPLLYGLFGGFAFVLRSINTETKNMTFTSSSNIKFGFSVRFTLIP